MGLCPGVYVMGVYSMGVNDQWVCVQGYMS